MRKLFDQLQTAHLFFASLAHRAQSPLFLLIRLYWGWQFAQSGWGKLHRLDQVAQFFATLGLPAPGATALFVSLVECLGGVLFALGLGARLVSLVLFVNMTVAFWTADREAFLSILSDPGKFYIADPYTFWFAALLILVCGPGVFALDALFSKGRKPGH
jgi:putative oxidoreductase